RWHDNRHKANYLHKVICLLDRCHAAEIPILAPESGLEKRAVGVEELETPAIVLEVIDDGLETGRYIHVLAIAFPFFGDSLLLLIVTDEGPESCSRGVKRAGRVEGIGVGHNELALVIYGNAHWLEEILSKSFVVSIP